MIVRHHPRLASLFVESKYPAVLFVESERIHYCLRAVVGPNRLEEVHIAIRGRLRVGGLHHRPLPVIHPFHFACLHAQDREARQALLIAHLAARRDVFGVAGFGHKIRHNRELRSRCRLMYARDHVFFVRREL